MALQEQQLNTACVLIIAMLAYIESIQIWTIGSSLLRQLAMKLLLTTFPDRCRFNKLND